MYEKKRKDKDNPAGGDGGGEERLLVLARVAIGSRRGGGKHEKEIHMTPHTLSHKFTNNRDIATHIMRRLVFIWDSFFCMQDKT